MASVWVVSLAGHRGRPIACRHGLRRNHGTATRDDLIRAQRAEGTGLFVRPCAAGHARAPGRPPLETLSDQLAAKNGSHSEGEAAEEDFLHASAIPNGWSGTSPIVLDAV